MFHLFNLTGDSGHLITAATINHSYIFNTEAPGYSSRINSRITATDDRHFASQVDLNAKVDLLQEIKGMKDSGGILTRNPHPLTHASTRAQENGFVALVEDLTEVFHRGIRLNLYTQILYIAYIVTEHLFGQSVFGDTPAQ